MTSGVARVLLFQTLLQAGLTCLRFDLKAQAEQVRSVALERVTPSSDTCLRRSWPRWTRRSDWIFTCSTTSPKRAPALRGNGRRPGHRGAGTISGAHRLQLDEATRVGDDVRLTLRPWRS